MHIGFMALCSIVLFFFLVLSFVHDYIWQTKIREFTLTKTFSFFKKNEEQHISL